MGKKWIRLLSMALCLTIPLGYAALAADMAPPDGMMGPPPGGDMGAGGRRRGQRTNQCSHCDYGRGGGYSGGI